MFPDLWIVLLAGGAGRRLTSMSGGVPKQFWAYRDGPTLIEETARRVAPLASVRQRVTVVDATHAPYVQSLRYRDALGQIEYQPADRGTAAGVLLGLMPILAADPEAIVVLTPSDHGVLHVDPYHRGILAAARLVRSGRREAVLFGIEPQSAAPDFGWITPGRPFGFEGERFADITRFAEKPGEMVAKRLLKAGAVWNTMVLVGRARAIFDQCAEHAPDLSAAFAPARLHSAPQRQQWLEAQYSTLTPVDFSRDIITHAAALALYTWPAGMGWTDLGTPDRVRAWRASPSARACACATALRRNRQDRRSCSQRGGME